MVNLSVNSAPSLVRYGMKSDSSNQLIMDIIGWKALKESVKLFGPDSPATILKPDLSSGIDPDDYFSSIPYGT